MMLEMTHPTFEDRCIISCGMLHPEMAYLMDTGFLNPRHILFTPPGLHALPDRLETYLLKRLAQVREWCPDHKIIVVYGKKCHNLAGGRSGDRQGAGRLWLRHVGRF